MYSWTFLTTDWNKNTLPSRTLKQVPNWYKFPMQFINQWCMLAPTIMYLAEHVRLCSALCYCGSMKASWTLVFYRLVCLWSVWAIFWRPVSWIPGPFSGTQRLLQVHMCWPIVVYFSSKYTECVYEFSVYNMPFFTGNDLSISVVNGTFTWDEIERPTLSK